MSARALFLGDEGQQDLKPGRKSGVIYCTRGRLVAVSTAMLLAGACLGEHLPKLLFLDGTRGAWG